MAMEKEALTHKIEDDLAARNRNWDKVDSLQTAHNGLEAAHAAHLAESATQFDRLQHYNAIQAVPYESGDNRWRDLTGVGFYYAGTSNVGYPQVTGILIHFKLPVTTATWQVFIGNAGQIWTRRVATANFADVEWVAV